MPGGGGGQTVEPCWTMDEPTAARLEEHEPVNNVGQDWCVCAEEIATGQEIVCMLFKLLETCSHFMSCN